MRQRSANRSDVAHHVQLPVGVPLVVGNVLEARVPRDPDVVDEHVEPAERGARLGDRTLGLTGAREIRRDVGEPRPRRVPARRPQVTTRAPSATSWRATSRPMPAGRAGDETPLAGESEIHAHYRIRRGNDDRPGEARRDGLEPRQPLPGTRRSAAQRHRPRAGARRSPRTSDDVDFAAAYTSPLLRARETAEILGAALGLERPSTASIACMEVDVGSWSGLTRHRDRGALSRRLRALARGRHGWDDGETNDELGARVVAGLLVDRRHGTRTRPFWPSPTEVRFALRSQPPTASRSTATHGSTHGIGNCMRCRARCSRRSARATRLTDASS